MKHPHQIQIFGNLEQDNLMFLPYLDTSSSKKFSLSEKLSIFTNIATNPKEILVEADIEEDSMGKLKKSEIINLSKILSLHTKQRNTILCKKIQNTYVYRQASLKPCNIAIGLKSLPFKKK